MFFLSLKVTSEHVYPVVPSPICWEFITNNSSYFNSVTLNFPKFNILLFLNLNIRYYLSYIFSINFASNVKICQTKLLVYILWLLLFIVFNNHLQPFIFRNNFCLQNARILTQRMYYSSFQHQPCLRFNLVLLQNIFGGSVLVIVRLFAKQK